MTQLLLIDGYSFLFRAYHSLPPLTDTNGTPVGAVYGMISMIMKCINDFHPKYIGCIFDTGQKTFRHNIYSEYKANRKEVPEDLKPQFEIAREAVLSLGVSIYEKLGYEADDVIATLAKLARLQNIEVIIVSLDKDLMQLIGPSVSMYDSMKNKIIKEDDVITKFGIPPHKVADYLSLVGDASDNIPGGKGIGPKTAVDLLLRYNSIEEMFNEEFDPKKAKLLLNSKDNIILSKKLVTLKDDAMLDIDIDYFLSKKPDTQILESFISRLGFKSLLQRINKTFDINATEVDKPNLQKSFNFQEKNIESVENIIYIDSENTLFELLDKYFKIYIKTNEDLIIQADNKYYYYKDPSNIVMNKICNNKSIKKICSNSKDLIKKYNNNFDAINDYFDVIIADYILRGTKADSVFAHVVEDYKLLYGNINHEIDIIIIGNYLQEELVKHNKMHLFLMLDNPFAYVLALMEKTGIYICKQELERLNAELVNKLQALESEIHKKANTKFNINSPKQLSEVLFELLRLPAPSKTSSKGQNISTSSEILEDLAFAGFDIAKDILEYRKIAKLINTYTEALPKSIDPITNRIHTTFLQTSTLTGRLSSKNPNLQNIPIRSNEGKEIRKAFIAKEGYSLISCDYSQVELKILAHIANVTTLKEEFELNFDIHSKTAEFIFKTKDVTGEMRSFAKAINFGIVYGIGASNLAKQFMVSRQVAQKYIDDYFVKYPQVKEYMEIAIKEAKSCKFVETLFQRRCYIEDIDNQNIAIQNRAKRAAINAKIQGSASDIIKFAMIKLHQKFQDLNYDAKILLQIHDELIIEVNDNIKDEVLKLVIYEMENAFDLSPALKVDGVISNTW
jgi:DNA polymerase-1